MAGAVIVALGLAVYGTAGSYETVSHVARQAGVPLPGLVPVGIDGGLTHTVLLGQIGLVPATVEEQVAKQRSGFRTLVQMDGQRHKVMRAIGADWFMPRVMRRMETRIQELAKRYVDRMADLDGRCDFVTDVAAHFPL